MPIPPGSGNHFWAIASAAIEKSGKISCSLMPNFAGNDSTRRAVPRSQASTVCRAALSALIEKIGNASLTLNQAYSERCLPLKSAFRGLPVRIYVPLDTIRDYLEVNDAARATVAALEQIPPGSAVTKIIAAERPTTISEIIALFRKVSWRPPKIITSMTRSSSLYAKRIQFKSWLRPDLRAVYRTSLVVGISAVLDAERMRYAHDG